METQRPLNIAFMPASENGLGFRGTEVSLFDYMFFNQKILHNFSTLYLKEPAEHNQKVLDLFKSNFKIIHYTDTEDLENVLLKNKTDAVYNIKFGLPSGSDVKKTPMLVHCVYDMTIPHGLVFAAISEDVSTKFNQKAVVPHIVSLFDTSEDFREELGIPKNAKVFGRHGGEDTWDLEFVRNTIFRILSEQENYYFIFAVRPIILKNVNHSRIICLDSFVEAKTKRKFINTCDAMIHAQTLGETQGLSCLEFSAANKPVITWNGGKAKQHLKNLKDKCILYEGEQDLYDILISFDPAVESKKDWRAVEQFSPENVMKIFDDVFLTPVRALNRSTETYVSI